eukprot:comp20109_c0_seq1/m.24804 comp20109_c0_seq1/g.24804  ORF comp20109_c0_seq1/g.24804 comp20109_c0_seq1/m.24804 type:complete len:326 (-) comp20109_c0_seq1:120-1097(-)
MARDGSTGRMSKKRKQVDEGEEEVKKKVKVEAGAQHEETPVVEKKPKQVTEGREVKKEAKIKAEAQHEGGEGKKSGKKNQIKVEYEGDEGEEAGQQKGGKGRKKKEEKVLYIAFVGQLPYTATTETISKYFKEQAKLGPSELKSVRVLTNKETGQSRGMAFVEVTSGEALARVVALHHHKFDGRKINVEESGQGGKAKRKLEAAEARLKLKEKRKKEVDKMIEKLVSESPEALSHDDFDEQLMKMLYTDVPLNVGKAALEEFVTLDTNVRKVKNRTAYLTGIVKKHHLATDTFRKPAEGKKKKKGTNRWGGGGAKGPRRPQSFDY